MAEEEINSFACLFESHDIVTQYLYLDLTNPFTTEIFDGFEENALNLVKTRESDSSYEACLQFSAQESKVFQTADRIIQRIKKRPNDKWNLHSLQEDNTRDKDPKPILCDFHSICETHIPLLSRNFREEFVFEDPISLPYFFKTTGFGLIRKAIPQEILATTSNGIYNHIHLLLERLSELPPGTDIRFREVMMRDKGRYDSELLVENIWEDKESQFWENDAPWLGCMENLLGENYILCKQGVVFSTPGTNQQYWHADGPEDLEPYQAICCFIPLVDLNEDTGYTTFWAGTHELKQRHLLDNPKLSAHLNQKGGMVKGFASQGDVLIYDYKVIHRGEPNFSDSLRPILYLVYSRQGFQEKNFSSAHLDDILVDH
eukprot:CAMPEP_0117822034 /NCGR_PEP_ID=MMETSP0949-20121206/3431_1 /TAXON_ID=44440 /ORGANISM="Chattonella subsalsa, Strain CCMP2191" /LENGTH=372 /DNA_ID=CAMNT_0005661319 /DNA_START=83 /DNA_END=1201 /DNA_ORIENTATION=-